MQVNKGDNMSRLLPGPILVRMRKRVDVSGHVNDSDQVDEATLIIDSFGKAAFELAQQSWRISLQRLTTTARTQRAVVYQRLSKFSPRNLSTRDQKSTLVCS